jgi:hypothetical protein
MNAAASSLIEAIKYSFGGDPYASTPVPIPGPNGLDWNSIPTGTLSWYRYGSGGVNGWGSLCGVPNGCAAVLNLMGVPSSTTLEQIMFYASQTSFPISLDADWAIDPVVAAGHWKYQPVPDSEVLTHQIATSPLCHISISRWCDQAGIDLTTADTYGTKHKTDRCAKVASAIAAFTAELINNIPKSLTMPTATAECRECHHDQANPTGYAQQGKMDCGACHTDQRPHLLAEDETLHPPEAKTDPVDPEDMVSDFTVTFDDNSDDKTAPAPRPQDSLEITVNWGDGHVTSGKKGGDSFSHTYILPGKYIIVHTAKDLGNLYDSEMITVSVSEEVPDRHSIKVNVKDNSESHAGIPMTTLYLKRSQHGANNWIQIMYGYTGADGSKTFTNLIAGYDYKVVVYKSGTDFDGSEKGTQNKVDTGVYYLTTSDIEITVTQGDSAANGPTDRKWTGDDGTAYTIS